MSPISTSTPSKALAKDLVTSLRKPSNLCTNSIHYAFCKNSLVCGYPSKNFLPAGFVLTITPMVEKLCLKTICLTGYEGLRGFQINEDESVSGKDMKKCDII